MINRMPNIQIGNNSVKQLIVKSKNLQISNKPEKEKTCIISQIHNIATEYNILIITKVNATQLKGIKNHIMLQLSLGIYIYIYIFLKKKKKKKKYIYIVRKNFYKKKKIKQIYILVYYIKIGKNKYIFKRNIFL